MIPIIPSAKQSLWWYSWDYLGAIHPIVLSSSIYISLPESIGWHFILDKIIHYDHFALSSLWWVIDGPLEHRCAGASLTSMQLIKRSTSLVLHFLSKGVWQNQFILCHRAYCKRNGHRSLSYHDQHCRLAFFTDVHMYPVFSIVTPVLCTVVSHFGDAFHYSLAL